MTAPGSTPAVAATHTIGGAALVAGTAIAVVVAFLFRFLTTEYTNDHFVHLSRGAQILFGDVPIRDFFDPGLTLQYYASSAALLWSGHNLFGEAILTEGFIAAGAGLTFIAAARLSGSLAIASGATLIGILSTPRLYGYPKVFFYALAIVAAIHYASRPGRVWRTALAVITAIAFLFRHDHGVYVALASGVLFVTTNWGQSRRLLTELTHYGLLVLILLSPFLIFVQSTTGLARYVTGISPQIRRVSTFQVNWLPITLDRSAPWLEVSPAPERRVNVRWAPELDDEGRRALESRYGLTRPEHVEDSTWSYVPEDESRERVGAIVNEPAVLDTHGIDRTKREIDIQEPLYLRLQRLIPILRWQVAPGIFSRENALAWLYYVTFLLPFACLVTLILRLRSNTIGRAEASAVAMATALSLIVVQTLVRGSPDSRLADVANPICILGAWLAASVAATPLTSTGLRLARTGLVSTLALITLWGVVVDARVLANLEIGRVFTGPVGIWDRMGVVSERLKARPIENWERDDAGIPGLGRYVFECTAPTDRLFVTWFAPQTFFYAERAFAGGQVYLTANWHASPADQQLTIERLERQRVPIVLERTDGDYKVRFPLVFEYVQTRYRDAPITADSMKGYRVLVDRNIAPSGTYEPLSLPCYR